MTPIPPRRRAGRPGRHRRNLRHPRWRSDGDRGSSDALGLALVAPAALGLALVIVLLGRAVDGRATVQGAAESAAQAAARERVPAAAVAAAERVGAAMLADHPSCAEPRVAVDTTGFRPGGVIEVTISCGVDTAGLEIVAPARPARSQVTAHATIDPFRHTELGR